MALFKILKGNSKNLPEQKATEGYAYFTPDDGKFYIDIATTNSKDDVIVGNINDGKANRICINQRVVDFNDYTLLDCGTATEVIDSDVDIIFDCGTSV